MSSASAASSSSKKVEWYHLDRVAIAKRICLDPTAVKLKTALNNNNNDYSSSATGPGTKTPKNNNNNVSQHRARLYLKPGFESGGSRVGHVTSSSVEPSTKVGLFSTLRYAPKSGGGGASSHLIKSIPPSFPSSAGSRQFAALQQKRRRKAARALAAETGTKQAKKPARDCPVPPLGEECLLPKGGGTSFESSECGSSSGVSSDFEELDASSGNSTTTMKGTSAGPRGGGDCQSSSDCEDEDEEGSIEEPPPHHQFTSSSSSSRCHKTATSSSSNDGSVVNHNNLSNLNILTSVSVLIDGVGASASGGGKSEGVVTLCKGGGGKIGFVTSSNKANNPLLSGNKMRTEVTAAGKHGGGSSSSSSSTSASSSSASSTASGSIDNDRDTDNSFSEFPTDHLDFMGVMDKGKRRTDRYDSSESSDSGVATLSPSTSDSPELISTCCDFSSEEHLDVVGNLISASRSSSLSTGSSSSTTYPTISSSSKSSSSPSSASSTSSCSGSSSAASSSSSPLTERQGEPGTTGSSVLTTASIGSTTGGFNAGIIIEASLLLPSSSSSSSTGSSDTGSSALLQTNPPVHQQALCLWKACTCSTSEASHNILEHIQTTHVAPQMKTAGYVCLWEGCKVFNKRSSSLSWLERHVLSHSGNKPFKCIFPGCGLSFSSQTTLERHVNSHIATNGTTSGAQGSSTVANKKIDASPAKSSRRKKSRFRRQKVNIGQRVDYFDKRIMEVIKHWLASSVDQFAVNAHDCTFRGEVMARRVIAHCERQVLVRWHPRFILPDEWMSESKFTRVKLVPLRRIPADKIRLLYPSLFPPARQEKATRKRKSRSNNLLAPSSSARSTPTHSEGSSSLTTLPPSPSELPSFFDGESFMCASSRSTRSSSSSSLASLSSFSTSTSSSASSSTSLVQHKSSHNQKKTTSSTTTTSSRPSRVKSGMDRRGEDKCHKRFCGSSSASCDCPSALLAADIADDDDDDDPDEEDDDEDITTTLESSHWALEVLYEDFGMFSS